MKLDELHQDADEIRRHGAAARSLPFDTNALDQSLLNQPAVDSDAPTGHQAVANDPYAAYENVGHSERLSRMFSPASDSVEPRAWHADELPRDFDAGPRIDETPVPPPPPEFRQRQSWWTRLRPSRQRATADDLIGPPATAPSRRQRNPAPLIAAGLVAIVLFALVAGLISKQKVDGEALRIIEGKRAATERAVALLGGQPQTTAAPPAQPPLPSIEPASAEPSPRLPADGRERHEAMLSAIKTGAVLASLPPNALAQPSPLPAQLPEAAPSGARAGAARSPQETPSVTLPPKRVALLIEGHELRGRATPISERALDPLEGTKVSASLKGSAAPHHRVYQLRENEGEWVAYVAPVDADPLAAGVWAGTGDLLTGGWRVADVSPQRLTLVGPKGALEILRP